MNKIQGTIFTICLLLTSFGYSQKTVSEGTISYNILVQSGKEQLKTADTLYKLTSTVFLKGNLSRTDMSSALGNESVIHDTKNGAAFILRDYSGQKLMVTLTKENWIERNKKYEGINFKEENETKSIAGFNCKKATASLNDSSTIIVYYSIDFNTLNKEYDQKFKNLPGIPFQYEISNGKMKYIYIVSKVDPAPVPVSKFERPKSAYRVMTYDESQQVIK